MNDERFEQRLRDALRARADDVRPDPAMWTRVRERAERRRRLAWVAATAALAPLVVVAVAVTVLPGAERDDDGGVVLDTAPSPAPSPSAAPAPTEPAGLVLATDPGVVLADGAGETVATLYRDRAALECGSGDDCEEVTVTAARVRPGTTGGGAAVAFLESRSATCGIVGVAGAGTSPYLAARTSDAADACDSAPVWSPDGLFVAFVRQVDDGFRLAYMAWNSDAGQPYGGDHVTVDLEGGEGLSEIRVHDWVWTDGPDETPFGVLVMTARDASGDIGLYQLPLERPVAYEFDLAAAGPIAPLEGAGHVLAYADGAEARSSSEGPSYMIEAGAGAPVLVASGDSDQRAELPLPAEVLDPAAPDGDRVWLAERGGVLLFGDGVDDAWSLEAPGAAGWGEVRPLPGDVRAGDVLSPADAPAASDAPLTGPEPPSALPGPGATGSEPSTATPTPTPTDSTSPAPRPSPSPTPSASPSRPASPSPEPSDSGPPAAVLATRDALAAAAVARSYGQLEALLPADGDFTSSYGGEQDHVTFYRQEEALGVDVFGELAAVLGEQPQEYGAGMWLYGPIEELGWRVHIDPDGTWRGFVAGD